MKLSPHPHAEIIKAWAEGHIIEHRQSDNHTWASLIVSNPNWLPDWQYRIKPQPSQMKEFFITVKVITDDPAKALKIQDRIGIALASQRASNDWPYFTEWDFETMMIPFKR